MSIEQFANLDELAARLRNLLSGIKPKKALFLFAHNGTGKTRLSMSFKQAGKRVDENGQLSSDTLYFNAFTEDLFSWDNDLEEDAVRVLKLNMSSKFFAGLQELAMEDKIRDFLHRFADFNFDIDYELGQVQFERMEIIEGRSERQTNIKISRGEENLFIWCFFLAIMQLALDQQEAYRWVKYVYIDDPVSSLDENHIIAVACGLAAMIRSAPSQTQTDDGVKIVVSTHHSLFFNVLHNEVKRMDGKNFYFLHKKQEEGYALQVTSDTPFFHHIASLSELQQAAVSDRLFTYHFNGLRSILEKTASFLGYSNFEDCLRGVAGDERLFQRALNLFSHGKYSIFDPVEMGADNKQLFRDILQAFIEKYQFNLPAIFNQTTTNTTT